MKEDSDRVFDVSKPHRVSPSPNSRPVIVGHHPMTSDPMMREDADPTQSSTAEHKAIPVFEPDDNPGPSKGDGPDESDVSPTLAPTLAPEHPESVVAVAPEPLSDQAEHHGSEPTYADPPAEHESGPGDHQYDSSWESQMQQGGMPHHGPGDDFPPGPPTDQGRHHHHANVMPEQIYHRRRRWPKVLLVLIILLVAGYLAIDSRLIKSSIKLPFHVFKQPAPVSPLNPPAETPPAQPVSTVPALPSGFANYLLPNTTISFDYPTVWGAPTTTTEGGYSSRSTTAKSDGVYAYLTNFATNKDVQVVLTSAKYLPPTRALLYYDYLQWCVGTNDGLIYKSTLRFNTTAGVSTPSTVTCDQGPLTDANKLNSTTIVQPKTTNPDGSALGDLYTMNLKDSVLPVIRVKDGTSSNGIDIKQLLATVDLTTPTSTTSSTDSTTTPGSTSTGTGSSTSGQ